MYFAIRYFYKEDRKDDKKMSQICAEKILTRLQAASQVQLESFNTCR